MFYVCTDRQGSITALLKQTGAVSERYSYDAYGRRRKPTNWNDYNVKAPRLISRGYTGHEHLDGFGLINMNGRMYDPVIGRVLSPDVAVQAPGYTQSYNRYSYCMNNPLKYTDPSGWYMDIGRGINTTFEEHNVSFYTYGIGSPGNYYSGQGSGGGVLSFGLPGQNGNGIGLNGTYYDWRTSTYRSTSPEYREVGWDYTYNHSVLPNATNYNFSAWWDKEKSKQKAFEDKMRLAAASNIGYGKSFGGPYDDLVEEMKKIWYSAPVRNFVPDLITFSLDLSCVTIYGAGISYQLNFLTRGTDPGIFITNTVSLRYGFAGDMGINLGWGNYQGNAKYINRESLLDVGYDIDGGYIWGANIWTGGGSIQYPTWIGAKAGIGLTLGGSGGLGFTSFGLLIPYK